MSEHDKDPGHEPHTTTIYVNGTPKLVDKKDELTYDDIVHLAFETPPTGADILITITYHKGDNQKPEGSLVPGGKVKAKEGMEFDVTATNRS
ncbi:MAG: multiubiquitin domain-containing protein [Pyrinomonadaceae bacterium]